MIDLRQTVLAELERRGWSRYKLAKLMSQKPPDDRICAATIYQWLAGRTHISDDRASAVLSELGLVVRPEGR